MATGERGNVWVPISEYIPGKIFITKFPVSRSHWQKRVDMLCVFV